MSFRGIKWTRPLIELVVIFLGVSLSFVADDWREGRNDRRDEMAALRLIHDELLADSADLAKVLPALQQHYDGAAWIAVQEERASVPDDSVAAAVEGLFPYELYPRRRAAFDNLKGTDRLTLIQSDSLRTAILRYY